MPAILILTAAGSSTRMGSDVKKEYLTVRTEGDSRISVLSEALCAFLATRLFSCIVITVPRGGEREARATLAEDRRVAALLAGAGLELRFAEGGSSRQESVKNGLESASEALAGRIAGTSLSGMDNRANPDIVLIHDGARPWISDATIKAVISGVSAHGASVPAIPSVDTQKETDEKGKIVRHLDRARVVSVQTPQGFLFWELLEAHRKAAGDGRSYTDDTEIWGRYAGDVYVCEGSRDNRKITWPGDL